MCTISLRATTIRLDIRHAVRASRTRSIRSSGVSSKGVARRRGDRCAGGGQNEARHGIRRSRRRRRTYRMVQRRLARRRVSFDDARALFPLFEVLEGLWRDRTTNDDQGSTRRHNFKVAPPMTGGTRGVTTPRSYGDGYASLDARNCARMTSADKALMMPNTINPRWAPVKTTREVRAMKTKSRPTTVLA